MSRSLKIRHDCLEQTKLALKRNGFPSQRILAEESAMALSTISNFLRGKSVDYATFIEICHKLKLEWQTIADLGDCSSSPPPTVTAETRQDWGEAIDVSIFYNRTDELATLKQWIVSDRCRLVSIMGMGGIGKTALSVKLAEQMQGEFDYLIWRSLRNAPPFQEILTILLQFFGNRQETDLPESINEQLSRLMAHLRTSRCLLILDNAESILQSGVSRYRPEDEGYGQFFKCIAETAHNSCLVLTSREPPPGVAALEGETLPVRCLKLSGLSPISNRGTQTFSSQKVFYGDRCSMVSFD